MFPVSGSLLATPPFPRLGPGESSSPTSQVLRGRYDFPLTHFRSLICFASGDHTIPPCFVLAASSAPGQAEAPPRARIIVQSAIQIAGSFSRGREWDLSGSQATHPVPLPRSKTPAEPTFLANDGTVDAAPASVTTKASALLISGLPRGFSTCCLRFTSDVATAHARLASGWLAGLCREGVEPSGSQ